MLWQNISNVVNRSDTVRGFPVPRWPVYPLYLDNVFTGSTG